ncbi:MAG: hypothetical protein HY455_03425 [Parcubacteria group bacterium]|nr:hypothetical protein [Parcubacteria group bacterium]
MGNMLEETTRNRLIQSIVNKRFPSNSPEDRLGAKDLRKRLERMRTGALRNLDEAEGESG